MLSSSIAVSLKGERSLINVKGKSAIEVKIDPKVKPIRYKDPKEKLEESGFFPEPAEGRKPDLDKKGNVVK